MKEKTACFTGHRNIPLFQTEKINKRLYKSIAELIAKGYCYFGAGGALGFDTLAAQTILSMKKEYPHIKLILVLPCSTQANAWSIKDQRIYQTIKSQADKVVYTAQDYTAGCMHKRNRHLVDHSSACICYLTENRGGTFYTVQYAKSKGLHIINVAEK